LLIRHGIVLEVRTARNTVPYRTIGGRAAPNARQNISGKKHTVPSLISLEGLRGGLFCSSPNCTLACDAMLAPCWLGF